MSKTFSLDANKELRYETSQTGKKIEEGAYRNLSTRFLTVRVSSLKRTIPCM